jgi:CHAD domain-containing protein
MKNKKRRPANHFELGGLQNLIIFSFAMPFHLKKNESLDKGVRRVCREHLGEALTRLRKSRHPAAVHGVRKEIKKLRALLRLVQEGIGRNDYRKTENALCRAADRLAASRDARVMLQAFAQVAGGKTARRFPKIWNALQKNRRREACRFRGDNSIAAAKKNLKKIDRRWAGLKIKLAGWAAIEPGLRESIRRGRQSCELARRQPSSEHFHEWRKQVKKFWHQLRLLCPVWPAAARGLIDRLEHLGELLGKEHDLSLLKQFIQAHGADEAGETAVLDRLIEASQKKLRVAALKLGARLYAEASAAVCRRLGNYWDRWRGE